MENITLPISPEILMEQDLYIHRTPTWADHIYLYAQEWLLCSAQTVLLTCFYDAHLT